MDDIIFVIVLLGLFFYIAEERPFECSEEYKVKVVLRAKEAWEREYQDLIAEGVSFTEYDAENSIKRCCGPLPRCSSPALKGTPRCSRPSYC